ncbi:MAG TPA: TIGR04282 family arsenosugar biosynthesis glycosyltransferase [Verrucomicrobiae bacterium]|nr:TIGR04282 family arsenosugar biosynthesis glycosyltransferase [Verrucomicrobiae bacterium]
MDLPAHPPLPADNPAWRLVVFVKAPRTGKVKTRLAATIGDQAACNAYRVLALASLRQLQAFTNGELRFSPDEARGEIEPWRPAGWLARPQGDGDLGGRLARAFDEHFASGAARVVIVGTDCPYLTPADIHSAWLALETHDLVLGPARDGGYWLIGLKQSHTLLLRDISWSTADVLNQTLQQAAKLNLRAQLLRELEDVDDESGWRAFLERANQA